MGFNEARLWLVASGWSPAFEEPNEITFTFESRDEYKIKPINLNEFLPWVIKRGFEKSNWSDRVFEKDGCEISVATEYELGFIVSIRMSFLVFSMTAKKVVYRQYIDEWKRLVIDLERDWGFSIWEPGSLMLRPSTDFLEMISQTNGWLTCVSREGDGERKVE